MGRNEEGGEGAGVQRGTLNSFHLLLSQMDQVRNASEWLIVRAGLFIVLRNVLGFEIFDNKRGRTATVWDLTVRHTE